jgi:hypothetical protein
MDRWVIARWPAVAAMAAACATPVAPRAGSLDGPVLTVDKDAYEARYLRGEGPHRQFGFRLVARLSNRSAAPVYLERCYPDWPHPLYGVGLEEGVGSTDVDRSAYDGIWACVGHDRPIVVAPGDTRVDTLEIVGPNSWDGRTKAPLGVFEGRFRLGYRTRACPTEVDCVRAGSPITSNAFAVRLVR